jgi:hypothetical protein
MISVSPFSTSVMASARLFFVLREIDADQIEIVRRTPAGDDPFTDANVYRMDNGKLMVTLDHPLKYSGNLVLIAQAGGVEEIINLQTFERLIEFYDRQPDVDVSQVGVFVFCKSEPIYDPSMEWRCDNTMYGARVYDTPSVKNPQLVKSAEDIIVYEPILTVPSVGHLVYSHLRNDEVARRDFIDNAELPIGAYTLGEMFKVLHEWATVAGEPFNNIDPISADARAFLDAIGFYESLVDGQVDMQVASYLRGKQNARLRPTNVAPTSPELLHFVRERMAFSSLSALSLVFPELVNTDDILIEEQRQLHIGIQKFRDYYNIPLDIPITDEERVMNSALQSHPAYKAFIHNQLRMFRNKREVLNRVSNGCL